MTTPPPNAQQVVLTRDDDALDPYYDGSGLIPAHYLRDKSLGQGTERLPRQKHVVAYNGVDQYATGPYADAFLDQTSGTFLSWVVNNRTSHEQRYFSSNGSSVNNRKVEFGSQFGVAYWHFRSGAPLNITITTTSNAFTIGEPVMLALVSDGASYTGYVNGQPVALTISGGSPGPWFGDVINRDVIWMGAATRGGAPVEFPWQGEVHRLTLMAEVLTQQQIENILNTGVLPYGPLADWKCEEEDGVTLYDSAGVYDYHLTYTNPSLPDSRPVTSVGFSSANSQGYTLSGNVVVPVDESNPANDILGAPLQFSGRAPLPATTTTSHWKGNGTDCHIWFPNVADSSFPLPITITCWFNREGSGSTRGLWQTHNSSSNYVGAYMRVQDNGALRFSWGDNRGTGSANRKTLQLGTVVADRERWYHLAVVMRGLTNVEVYVDNQLHTGSWDGNASSIGVNEWGGSIGRWRTAELFPGSIARFRYYTGALSAQQRAEDMLDVPLTGNPPATLMDYSFISGTGRRVYDLSGNNRHGTIHNGVDADIWQQSHGLRNPTVLDGAYSFARPQAGAIQNLTDGYIELPGNSDNEIGEFDWYTSGWSVVPSGTTFSQHHLLGKAGGTSRSAQDYTVFRNQSTGRIQLRITNQAEQHDTYETANSVPEDTWFHWLVWYNATARTAGVALNGQYTETSHTSGFTGANARVRIGRDDTSPSSSDRDQPNSISDLVMGRAPGADVIDLVSLLYNNGNAPNIYELRDSLVNDYGATLVAPCNFFRDDLVPGSTALLDITGRGNYFTQQDPDSFEVEGQTLQHITDGSGNANDGALIAWTESDQRITAAAPAAFPGQTVVEFQGLVDRHPNQPRILVPLDAADPIGLDTDKTLSFWMRSDMENWFTYTRAFVKSRVASAFRFGCTWRNSSDGFVLHMQGAGNNLGADIGPLSVGVWAHICGVYDQAAQTMKLYRDGVHVFDAVPVSFGHGDGEDLLFGGRGTSWDQWFDGSLFDFRIYQRQLSVPDIQALAAGGEPQVDDDIGQWLHNLVDLDPRGLNLIKPPLPAMNLQPGTWGDPHNTIDFDPTSTVWGNQVGAEAAYLLAGDRDNFTTKLKRYAANQVPRNRYGWRYGASTIPLDSPADEEYFNPIEVEPVPQVFTPAVGTGEGEGLAVELVIGADVPQVFTPAVGEGQAEGLQPTLAVGLVLESAVGEAQAEGLQADVALGVSLAPAVGEAEAEGLQPTVLVGAGKVFLPAVGEAAAEGLAVELALGRTLQPSLGEGQAEGLQAAVALGVALAPAVGTALGEGLQPWAIIGPVVVVPGVELDMAPARTRIEMAPGETDMDMAPARHHFDMGET